MILALSFRCEGDPVWEDGSMLIYKIVLSSLNRQASDKMHSSRLHLREGPMVPASLRPGPLSPCPSARAGALSRSPVSLYLLAGRVRHAGFTRCARSSMDRVADFESEGCRFESYRRASDSDRLKPTGTVNTQSFTTPNASSSPAHPIPSLRQHTTESDPKRLPRATRGATRVVAALEDDPDLAAVVDAWPDLPAALKAGIVAMAKATARVRS